MKRLQYVASLLVERNVCNRLERRRGGECTPYQAPGHLILRPLGVRLIVNRYGVILLVDQDNSRRRYQDKMRQDKNTSLGADGAKEARPDAPMSGWVFLCRYPSPPFF